MKVYIYLLIHFYVTSFLRFPYSFITLDCLRDMLYLFSAFVKVSVPMLMFTLLVGQIVVWLN